MPKFHSMKSYMLNDVMSDEIIKLEKQLEKAKYAIDAAHVLLAEFYPHMTPEIKEEIEALIPGHMIKGRR